jgi:SAM-dependent methyltransferase
VDGREALELAVGTGRIAVPLAATGVRVDGIEISQDMVDRMREKTGGTNVDVTIGDMSRVSTGRKYAVVYLVFNTIGNLLTQDDQVRCFQNAANHLTDDGVFVLECRIPTAPTRPGHQFVDAERVEVDHVMLDVCRYDPVTQILDVNHVRISAAGVVMGPDPAASRATARVRPDGARRRSHFARSMGRLEPRTIRRDQLAPCQRLRARHRPLIADRRSDWCRQLP